MFSIIIPNYNREKSILRAIESVLSQTFTNFELLVVDDCSTDNSRKLVSQIDDERLKLLQLPKNSGAAAARNYGIENSSRKYISLLDSDDFFEPNFLEETYNYLDKTDSSIGFSWTGLRFLENGKEREQIWKPKPLKNAYITFLNSLHIGTNSGITFKREIFEDVGNFNEDLPAAEDTDFFLRLTQVYNYIVIPEILINIERDHADRMSKNFRNIAIAYNQFLPAHFNEIDKKQELQAKFYYKMMWLNYNIDDKETARKYFLKIPKELRSGKVKVVKYIYEFIPLEYASVLHRKLST